MLVVDQFRESLVEGPESALLEIHHSKVSLHHANVDYDYPTIRLPYTFSKLAGLSTYIYETVHDGALAFLVIISKGTSTESSADPSENAKINARSPLT